MKYGKVLSGGIKMTDKEKQLIIDDMVIISDSREQRNEHIIKYLTENKIPYIIKKLDSADYSFELPHYPELKLDCKILIERKGSLDELAVNFTKGRERFQREFERLEDDSKIHMVLENFTIKKMLNGSYRSKFPSKSYIASLLTWCIRYHCPIWTVTTDESPELIHKLMHYELLEFLKGMK
jgi:ERCC4-type nuclease